MADDRRDRLVFRLNDHGQGPELLREVFLERGWLEFDEEAQDDEDWNLWWRTSRFRNSDYELLRQWQRVNHYPRSTAITKKDSLARNLKRMRGVYGPSVYNFSPLAFNLPNDYTKYVAEYSRLKEKHPGKDLCWICKPADLSRGRGIFIFRDLSELQYDCNAVVQQYLTNPLLISGYKFDLRIYVMVPSFHPLAVFIYQEGLVRFGTEKFDMGALRNMYAHLTNTSINKHSPTYAADKERVGPGCKWTLTQLRHYFRQSNIDDDLLWRRIINVVVLTLALQANQVPKATNCFELYGFDIIIDDTLKPWLLEVNFSPALSSDCQTDLVVKKPMLHDLLDFLDFQRKDTLRGYDPRAAAAAAALGVRGQGRLPSIQMGSLNSLTTGQSPADSATAGLGVEGDDSDSSDVVAVIPGCGLPSVQHPNTSSQCWRPSGGGGEAGGSRGSSASSRRSLDGPEAAAAASAGGGGGGTSDRHLSMSQRSLRRVDSKGSHLLRLADGAANTAEGTPRGHTKSKRDSKISIQSDSGVSSYSGSSDNLEINPTDRSAEHGVAASSRKAADKKDPSEERWRRRSFRAETTESTHQDKRVAGIRQAAPLGAAAAAAATNAVSHSSMTSKSMINMSNSTTAPLMSRYALTDHIPESLKPQPSGVPPASTVAPSTSQPAGKSTLPRGTRSSALRSSLHSDSGGRRKYGQFGYTANPLAPKSSLLNRRGSLNNVVNTAAKLNSYAKPWRRASGSQEQQQQQQQASQKTPTSKQFKQRVGDFFLVYPFNEATRKCGAGNQDLRTVIRETQKLLKEVQSNSRELSSTLFDILKLWDTNSADGPSS